ncbi:tigger transposable element-derived protein 1 [Trichonephila clavipes]|nr:tigger transposable element-derived protein 1 [Trichonephila clavipes]
MSIAEENFSFSALSVSIDSIANLTFKSATTVYRAGASSFAASGKEIVRVHYFVRGGFVGYRSRASSKHLSPHLPVDELDSSEVKKGLRCRGESATADEGAAKIFPEELAKIIEDGDYSADQVFNADETGLYWKKLPNRTYIAKDEKTASGHKASKDRVTLLLCSNASGDRILKPLLINKSLRPRALKVKI